jgi:hypothetical protein
MFIWITSLDPRTFAARSVAVRSLSSVSIKEETESQREACCVML